MNHDRVAQTFNRCFAASDATIMRGGALEPLYQPAGPDHPAFLRYRQDFAASALHEAAHWCIAGAARRRQTDFGYAYVPPPRSASDQTRFFALELRVQSLEAIFAQAAGVVFRASSDDPEVGVSEFAAQIHTHRRAIERWLTGPAGQRGARFAHALAEAADG